MRLPGLNRIYLTGSSVSVNGSLADQFSLKQGVPQGSCSWALAFHYLHAQTVLDR